MTKSKALYKIICFGRKEEHKLIAEGKDHEAYQIEYARNVLLYALQDSVKAVRKSLIEMTTSPDMPDYKVLAYVWDNFTRGLLEDFKNKF